MLNASYFSFLYNLPIFMGKQKLRKDVENGEDLGVPDGILINGFGPYRYDEALVQGGIAYQIINVEPGMCVPLYSMLIFLLFHQNLNFPWKN